MKQKTNETSVCSMPGLVRNMLSSDPILSALHIVEIGRMNIGKQEERCHTFAADSCSVVYCGEGIIMVDAEDMSFRIEKGQFSSISSGNNYTFSSDSETDSKVWFVTFAGSLASHYYSLIPEVPTTFGKSEMDRDWMAMGFAEIEALLTSSLSLGNLRYASALLHRVLGGFTSPIIRFGGVSPSAEHEGFEVIESVAQYMNRNLDKTLTLNDIANQSGYSPSYLSTLFKQQTGFAPLMYFNVMKIQLACQMIDKGEMQINQVCKAVGIDDPYYFSRLFSKIVGISPAAYRKSRMKRD